MDSEYKPIDNIQITKYFDYKKEQISENDPNSCNLPKNIFFFIPDEILFNCGVELFSTEIISQFIVNSELFAKYQFQIRNFIISSFETLCNQKQFLILFYKLIKKTYFFYKEQIQFYYEFVLFTEDQSIIPKQLYKILQYCIQMQYITFDTDLYLIQTTNYSKYTYHFLSFLVFFDFFDFGNDIMLVIELTINKNNEKISAKEAATTIIIQFLLTLSHQQIMNFIQENDEQFLTLHELIFEIELIDKTQLLQKYREDEQIYIFFKEKFADFLFDANEN